MSNFDDAFKYTVGNEGGYTNDKYDSGGPTNWGITQHDYAVFKGRPVSAADVKAMPISDAKTIYAKSYWLPVAADKLINSGVATCMFDIGVVRGIGVPPKYAQQICVNHGIALTQDGHLGPISIAAINSLDPATFIRDFSHMAENGFRSIAARRPTQNKFLRGWVNRARRLLTLIPKNHLLGSS